MPDEGQVPRLEFDHGLVCGEAGSGQLLLKTLLERPRNEVHRDVGCQQSEHEDQQQIRNDDLARNVAPEQLQRRDKRPDTASANLVDDVLCAHRELASTQRVVISTLCPFRSGCLDFTDS